MRLKTIITILGLGLLMAGCEKPPVEDADGKTLYTHYCAGCHGERGKGRFLRGIPANILTEKDDVQLLQVIHDGVMEKPNNPMPPAPHLTEVEAGKIVEHLYRLKREFEQAGGDATMLLKPDGK
jgi:mono/diheme cytochrome c family protein